MEQRTGRKYQYEVERFFHCSHKKIGLYYIFVAVGGFIAAAAFLYKGSRFQS